jgi:hypothetical protein
MGTIYLGLRFSTDCQDVIACLNPIFLLFQKNRSKRQHFLNCLLNLLIDQKWQRSSNEVSYYGHVISQN